MCLPKSPQFAQVFRRTTCVKKNRRKSIDLRSCDPGLPFESGYEGFVNFVAKSKLVEHYKETLHAKVLYDNHMAIDSRGAAILVKRYFNKEDIWEENTTL